MEQETKPKRYEFTLAAEHTHRGVTYGKGDTIPLREDQCARLEKAGKGKKGKAYVENA